MVRHVILFAFKAGTTKAQVTHAGRELARLPSLVPGIRRLSHGSDIGGFDANADYVLIADFDDLDGYVRYRDDPAHLTIIRETMEPIIERYIRIQFELSGPPEA